MSVFTRHFSDGRERVAAAGVALGLALGLVPLLSGSTFGTFQAAAFAAGAGFLLGGLALFVAASSPPAPRTTRARRFSLVPLGLFLLGLAIRLAFVGHLGTGDSQFDLLWGTGVHSHGLAAGYLGNYFPVEYEIFASVVVIHQALGIKAVVLLKLVNLLCDAGIYLALRSLLRRWSLNPDLALWYWLTPFFVALDWLGYVDFHLGLLALIAVLVLVSHPTRTGYLLAGVPLGMMLLTKPQAIGLMLALAAWVAIRYWLGRATDGRRRLDAALMFVAPAAIFAVYSAYFWLNGFKPQHLAGTLSTTGELMPALNAYMPNIWRIVGELYRHAGQRIEEVEKPDAFHYLSLVLGASIGVAFLIRLARRAPARAPGANVLLVFAVEAAVAPMIVTQAHENHFFLAGLFLLTWALLASSRRLLWGVQVLLLLMFVNLFGLYGFDITAYRSPLESMYTTSGQMAVAAAATLMFAWGTWWLWKRELLHPGRPT